MNHIKTFQIFESDNQLISILNSYGIYKFTINPDKSVDVDNYINLTHRKLTEIPLRFNKAKYDFNCSMNRLISLEGCPVEVGSNFYCSENNLTSLEYCPSEIGRDFNCSHNKLTMLDCSSYVKGNIYCYGMFEQEPEFFGDCEGKIYWKFTK